MKVVFMGTPDFAASILKALMQEHEVLAVITQPDKPKGRGKKLVFPPVKELAIENNIEVLQPFKIKDVSFIDELKKIPADVFIVAAYGQILPKSILDMPKHGSINVHGSLLPKYRGAAPIQWAVIDGENTTGVTIMQMDEGLDTGDMILSKSFDILPQDTSQDVYDKMAEVGAQALLESLSLIEKGLAVRTKQDSSKSTYARMIKKSDGDIDWSKTSSQIINLIRGLNPWPSAYTKYENDSIKIWTAEEVKGYNDGDPGEILDVIKDKGFVVKTSDSAILATEVQLVGKKRMNAADFLRGYSIEIEKRFSRKE